MRHAKSMLRNYNDNISFMLNFDYTLLCTVVLCQNGFVLAVACLLGILSFISEVILCAMFSKVTLYVLEDSFFQKTAYC